MLVNESNFETLEKASKITGVDYDIKWYDAEDIKGYIYEYNLLTIIEDLTVEINRLEETIEDIETDKRDNYRPISQAEQIGINDKDFI